jgi:hypothetical protein
MFSIDLITKNWQEAFEIRRKRFICPYCSKEQWVAKVWAIAKPCNLPVATCIECRIPFLLPHDPIFKSKEVRDELAARNTQPTET